MGETLRVLVVDDHTLIAESVAAALRTSGLEVALADLSSRDALIQDVNSRPPHLAILDLELGGDIGDGCTLVRPFLQAGVRILLMSAVTAPERIGAALEQGAHGYVAKSAPFLDLLRTAIHAAKGDDVMTPADRQHYLHMLCLARERQAAAYEPFERLTEREQQVLRAIADGLSVGLIAREWFLSESTVRSQVRGILTKLGVGSQIEALAMAMRTGWLQPHAAEQAPPPPERSAGMALRRIPRQR